MTDLLRERQDWQSADGAPCPDVPVIERLPVRTADVDGFAVRRALPTRHRRMVGAWCFLDHIGPADIADDPGLRVGPHPHTGLQTVTWLLEGEVLHRDSLGTVQTIRPGELNLMTSGGAISHSEESPEDKPDRLHAVQLWVALPEDVRHGPGAFEHHEELPAVTGGGFTATVFCGAGLGVTSPATVYSPLVGAHLHAATGAAGSIDLDPDWEHAVLVLSGAASVDGEELEVGELLYLGIGREDLALAASEDVDLVLVGGEPFGEDVVVWWNFVARSRDEVSVAAREWNAAAGRFGTVTGFPGDRIDSPTPPWERTG